MLVWVEDVASEKFVDSATPILDSLQPCSCPALLTPCKCTHPLCSRPRPPFPHTRTQVRQNASACAALWNACSPQAFTLSAMVPRWPCWDVNSPKLSDPFSQELSDLFSQELSDPFSRELSDPFTSFSRELSDPFNRELSDPFSWELSDPFSQELSDPFSRELSDPFSRELSDPFSHGPEVTLCS